MYALDVDRLLVKISERLYPTDPATRLRIYNPQGKLTLSVDEDRQTATDRRARGHAAHLAQDRVLFERYNIASSGDLRDAARRLDTYASSAASSKTNTHRILPPAPAVSDAQLARISDAEQCAGPRQNRTGDGVDLRDTPGGVLRSGVTRRDAGCLSARFTSARETASGP